MNLAVWSNRSSLISLCLGCAAVKTALLHTSLWGITTLCKVCGVFHEGKTKYNYAFKNCVPVLPTLQQGTPRVPRAGISDAPFFFSLQCKQGSCQGGSDHVLVFIKVWGSAIKRIARKSAGRVYSLKREVRKWELLKDKQQNEEHE